MRLTQPNASKYPKDKKNGIGENTYYNIGPECLALCLSELFSDDFLDSVIVTVEQCLPKVFSLFSRPPSHEIPGYLMTQRPNPRWRFETTK